MEVRPFMKETYLVKAVAPVAARGFERIEENDSR
jgi:hypothetical protein